MNYNSNILIIKIIMTETTIKFVIGKEQHSSNWGKFYLKGLEDYQAEEDFDENQDDEHHNYQGYVCNDVPDGTIFTIFEQNGNRNGTNLFCFRICQMDSAEGTKTYLAEYGSGFIQGQWREIAAGLTKIKGNRLLDWWKQGDGSLEYAEHCAQYIDKRGQKTLPPMPKDIDIAETPDSILLDSPYGKLEISVYEDFSIQRFGFYRNENAQIQQYIDHVNALNSQHIELHLKPYSADSVFRINTIDYFRLSGTITIRNYKVSRILCTAQRIHNDSQGLTPAARKKIQENLELLISQEVEANLETLVEWTKAACRVAMEQKLEEYLTNVYSAINYFSTNW